MICEKISKYANSEARGFQKSLILFIIGFMIIFLGVIFLMVAAFLSDGSANFGAVIFIGPFPIVVGIGPQAPWMVLFAIVLAVLSIVIFLVFRRETRKAYA